MAQQRNRKDPETVPSDVAAETFTLGAALISNAAADTVLAMLQADDYFNTTNRACFQAIGELRGAGNPVDIFSVQEPLGRRLGIAVGELRTYVHQLTEAVPTAAHVEFYARRVKQTANRRRILSGLRDATMLTLDTEDDEEAALRASEMIHAVTARFQRKAPKAITARELQVKELPPIHYVVDRYFPQGLILFHSRPKVGKTRLADVLALSVASGGRFLGHINVSQAGVLCLFLEDTEQSLQERLNQYLGEEAAPDGLEFFFTWKRIDQGGYADLDAYLQAHPSTKLVIVDTLQMVRPARGSQGDIYAEDVAALRQLKDLADLHSACLVVLHHSKKGSADEDLVDSAGGTSGNTGSADTIMRLRRVPGSDEAVLEGRGRKVRDFSLALRMDEVTGWQLLGDAQDVAQTSEGKEILELLKGEPMRPQDIAAELGISRNAIQQRLRRMALKGMIQRSRGGWYTLRSDDVTGVSGISAQTGGTVGTRNRVTIDQRSDLLGTDDPDPSLFDTAPSDGVTGVIPVTPVTGLTPLTSVTEKTNGFHPPGELPADLELEPDAEEPELRRNAFNLAYARGFPRLELGDNQEARKGEEEWRHFCRAAFPKWLGRALQMMGGEP
jgi:biotin operon repressor